MTTTSESTTRRMTQVAVSDEAFLIIGLAFFWQLFRHTCMSTIMPLAIFPTGKWGGMVAVTYYVLVALVCLATCLAVRSSVLKERFDAIGVVVGLLATLSSIIGMLIKPDQAPVVLFVQLLIVILYALATAWLSIVCLHACIHIARENPHAMLSCVFGSAFLSIMLTFVLSDLFSANFVILAVASPFCSAISLFLVARNESCAGLSGAEETSLRPKLILLVCLFAASVIAKCICDIGIVSDGGSDRILKHFISSIEIAALLLLAWSSRDLDGFMTSAQYLILCALVLGLALVAGGFSSELTKTGAATVTSARVCAECAVLAIGVLEVVQEGFSITKASLTLILPMSICGAFGYGVLPVVANNKVDANWTVSACILCMTVISLGAFGISWWSDSHIKPGQSDANQHAYPITFSSSAKATMHEPNAVQENKDLKLESKLAVLSQEYGLTPREVDVARYICNGYSTRQICDAECLSTNTVQTHIHSLYGKLEIHSRQDLVSLVKTTRTPLSVKDNIHGQNKLDH
jgi:DNA-binding CsgD family transcriptional regulator